MTTELHQLDNGLRVVTEHMPGVGSATIGLWVQAGARHEARAENGIAHFLEHMAFKGTARRSALQIAEEIENVGGYINAYTSRETTAYYARVLAEDVPLAFDVVTDIVLNPAFDAREVEVERGVILQEIGQVLDTPDDVIFDWLQEAAYPEQPLGRTILGPAKQVAAFGVSDLRSFVERHYGPERMILAAAGAVDHDQIVKLAEAALGGLGPHGPFTQEQASFSGGERRVEKALEQAHFTLGFEIPGFRSDAIYPAQIFSTAMGGGMSSRLFQEIREKRGLCYTVHSQIGAHEETGMMTLYAGTAGADVGQLARVAIDEMKRAADDMSQAELDRARAQIKAGIVMGAESVTARVERLARAVSIWNRVPPMSESVAKIDAVTLDDLRAFAARTVAAPVAQALYGPVGTALDLAQVQQRLVA